jgi:CRISPR-associated protein Csx17
LRLSDQPVPEILQRFAFARARTIWAEKPLRTSLSLLQINSSRPVSIHDILLESSIGSCSGVGRVLGEFWAPVWSRPFTLSEVTALFQRGKAEIDGRSAITPAAFAAAMMRRGIDSGIAEFRRFLLLKTTSENTFESHLSAAIEVASELRAVQSRAVRIVLALRDSLPRDSKKGKR